MLDALGANLFVFMDDVRQTLSYDPTTGIFRWLVVSRYRPGLKGSVAGTVNHGRGYRVIETNNVLCLAHRLAWVWVHNRLPYRKLDHINGHRDDNRIINLREVTDFQNATNKASRGERLSGFKGVSRRACGTWRANICSNRKQTSLGTYTTAEDAARAYDVAARELFGEFAKTNADLGLL